jgi:tRNA(Ile2)-agmatinylcytidine synthase
VLIALDDTDSRAGGCTTYLAFHVLLALPELALSGLPRLVRLNPNVPWKTRGNGAVVLPVGKPRGPQVRVGELRGREVLAFPEAGPVAATPGLLAKVRDVVRSNAQPEAQPGFVLCDEPLPEAAYWEAVRTRVEPQQAGALLSASGALFDAAGTKRALAGCMGALAWPGPPSSYEVLAYREPKAFGSPRKIDAAPLRGLDATGSTFHTYDAEEERLACVPHGPDPILVGLRGRDPDRLRDAALPALALAAREPIDGWLLWATNQGSGDHVTEIGCLEDAPEWGTIQVAATIAGEPANRRGGHVQVEADDADGHRFAAMAFEPTKGLRDVVRALRPGDGVTFAGAWEHGALKLEKMEVRSVAPITETVNPPCPACGRKTRSRGPSTGYRCPDCGTKLPRAAGAERQVPRSLAPGQHEVPMLARRHLHRPLAWR